MKSAFIAIVGRPSAGKSTLLNALCKQKVSIVSTVPQTTRNKVRGIVTEERGQLVFIDTPGLHNSDRKFNTYMKDVVYSGIEDAEVILYVVDSTRMPGQEERKIIELLKPYEERLILAINKTDLDNPHYAELKGLLRVNISPKAILEVSAKTKDGLDELKTALFDIAPEGDQMYPEEYYTDQEPEFRIAEVIREQAMRRTQDEIPHAIYVEMADMEMDEEENCLWVRAFLTVETKSQKGIVIGKGGEKIREIRLASRKILKKIFPYNVKLDLRVKVNPNWRKKDYLLKGIIK